MSFHGLKRTPRLRGPASENGRTEIGWLGIESSDFQIFLIVFEFVLFVDLVVGHVPMRHRFATAEAVLQGAPANPEKHCAPLTRRTAGAKPLPMTGYKLDLLSGLVHDVLERLAA
jgi:hypothetical protein